MNPKDIPAQFGPHYPDLGSAVMKYRRCKANGPIQSFDRQWRVAYADAIEKAIRAKQRSELQRELPSHNVNCASGTNHNSGAKIDKAVRAQHLAGLLACPAQERRRRTPEQWRAMYDKAMADKRARETRPAKKENRIAQNQDHRRRRILPAVVRQADQHQRAAANRRGGRSGDQARNV